MRDNEKQYLKTEEWQQKRLQRLKIDDYRCCRCGSHRNIQVHHLNYDRLGHEDVNNDLITLCDSCHESIEKETVAGCQYKKPFNYGSNFSIVNEKKIPYGNSIIYQDMKDICPEKQLQIQGGKIRLCKAHLACPDFYDDRKFYDECKEDGMDLKPYEEYQYKNDRTWNIFVHMNEWIHEVRSNVIKDGCIQELANGMKVLHIAAETWWEGYMPLARTEAEELTRILDRLQKSYIELIT